MDRPDLFTEVSNSVVSKLPLLNKKLSCCRKTVRRFVSLNILLSHSGSLKVIRSDTVQLIMACVSR